MRHIGISDFNNIPIFEGDTLEITDIDDINFEQEYLDFLKIDRMTIYIAPLDNEIGIELHCYFWANGKPVLNSEEKSYYETNRPELTQEQLQNHFEGVDMDKPICYISQSWHDSMFLFHGFIHKKTKTIIEHKIKLEDRDNLTWNYAYSNLTVTVDNVKYQADKIEFLIELSPEALKITKETHEALYDNMKKTGYFTHILVKPEKVNLYEYKLKCEPVNEHCEHSWFESYYDHNKYFKIARPIKKRWKEKIEKWQNENQHLSEEEINSHSKSMWEQAKAEFEPLKESEEAETTNVCTDLFMGLNMSKNLFQFFNDTKCKITAL